MAKKKAEKHEDTKSNIESIGRHRIVQIPFEYIVSIITDRMNNKTPCITFTVGNLKVTIIDRDAPKQRKQRVYENIQKEWLQELMGDEYEEGRTEEET